MKSIRVLLADDHFLVRQGLQKYLSHHIDIELVRDATDGEEAVKLTDSLKPDVVVMDINMPRMNGIEATSSITRKQPHLPHAIYQVFDKGSDVSSSTRCSLA